MNMHIQDKGVKIDFAAKMLEAYIEGDTPAMLWGPPGCGKSDIVAQTADKLGLALIDQRLTTLEPVDLRGLPHIKDGAAIWANPSILPDEKRDGPRGILFLDEINAAPASTQAACYQLILNRRIGEYRLPPGWRIAAAGNRQSDRASAQRMPSALANRFAHIDVVPDVAPWADWAIATNRHPAMIAFLRFRPQLFHLMPGVALDDGDIKLSMPADARAFPTPRSWTDAANYADRDAEMRQPLIAGRVGVGPSVEFEGFIRTFLDVPSIKTILADPAGAKVPQGPGALFAVSAALARAATPINYGAIMEYIKRIPKAYEVLTAVDSQKRNKSLAETGAWVSWCGRNTAVFA
ncbi:AAA family ATPase [Rhizobium azibense]|uniref:Dynein-related subfamily AAA family protein n=1 Tax=Rhizobium azibense TaxID=1136135 RepID=A0A4R3RI91_9HYPH|nr:MoxR family ATPase [Rhizobium azibense]TCU34099.1 dynein-related subfamily AAA family protein [Rhizobium azibense]